jgi:hypothetical protein
MACAAAAVSTDFDPAADFSSLQTYMWIDEAPQVDDVRVASGLVAARIRTAVETVLDEKGFRKASSGADFDVGWLASVEDKIRYQTFNRAHYGGRYGTYWTQETYAREYTEGTLIIDIYHGSSEELMWRGIGEGKARFDRDPVEAQARAIEVMREIFEDFPPMPDNN